MLFQGTYFPRIYRTYCFNYGYEMILKIDSYKHCGRRKFFVADYKNQENCNTSLKKHIQTKEAYLTEGVSQNECLWWIS